jgi:modulator of FtsH protease
MEGWGEFYVAEVGAAAAIAGLLVVAISINIDKIMAQPTLPGRGAQTLMIVGGALVIGSLGLFPRQSLPVFGGEALAVWVLVALSGNIQVRQARHLRGTSSPTVWIVYPLSVLAMSVIPGIIGGALLISKVEAGAYFVATGVILSLIAALIGGWVLLIEILR